MLGLREALSTLAQQQQRDQALQVQRDSSEAQSASNHLTRGKWSCFSKSFYDSILQDLQQHIHGESSLRKRHGFDGRLRIPNEFKSARPRGSVSGSCRAVVLDCEMVKSKVKGNFQLVLASLSVLDFFSGNIIISKHVKPEGTVIDWITEYSGITPSRMQKAILRGDTYKDITAARAALFECIDRDTIIVGHALVNDLNVLGVEHDIIVDSSIFVTNALNTGGEPSELAVICSELLKVQIQTNVDRRLDSVENCLAAREAVLWLTDPRHKEKIKEWVAEKWIKSEVSGGGSEGASTLHGTEQALAPVVASTSARSASPHEAVQRSSLPLAPLPIPQGPQATQGVNISQVAPVTQSRLEEPSQPAPQKGKKRKQTAK